MPKYMKEGIKDIRIHEDLDYELRQLWRNGIFRIVPIVEHFKNQGIKVEITESEILIGVD